MNKDVSKVNYVGFYGVEYCFHVGVSALNYGDFSSRYKASGKTIRIAKIISSVQHPPTTVLNFL